MENINLFIEKIWKMQFLNSIIIVILSIILYRIIIYFLEKTEEKNALKSTSSKKKRTYLKLVRSVTRYIFIILTVLILLQINGVDVSSVLTGVGILGIILGLAIQDWLKDIIRGSSILSDNYFAVGDVVKYKDIEGKVLVIGLKTTKIQDLKTSNILSIANRNIEEIEVVSNLIYINIPMPYEVSLERAEKAIKDINEAILKNNNVDGCRYVGVNDLADSSIKYLIEVKCNPLYKLQVRRDSLKSILDEMAKNEISVPYTQIDIHEKQ